MAQSLDRQKKLIEAKMLLDTFEIPNRPRTMSAHQYKKQHGSNQGYAAYKTRIQQERKEWDRLYKELQRVEKMKKKYLAEIDLSDEALKQAVEEAEDGNLSVGDVLSRWLEKGRRPS